MSPTTKRGRASGKHKPSRPSHLEDVDEPDGRGSACEPGVLLVHRADVRAVRGELEAAGVKIAAERELAEGIPVVRIELSTTKKGTVPGVLDQLHDSASAPLRVGPNTVLGTCSHGSMMPVTLPRPAPPRPALPEQPELPGEGVRVGVLDTGATDHPYFAGRCEFRPKEDEDHADVDEDSELDHDAGHGTFVTGVVLQHAPRATVVARRLDYEPDTAPRCSCTTDEKLATQLIANTELHDVDVLVLALGGHTYRDTGLVATEAALRARLADEPDLVIVAAAGNDARTDPVFPAAYPFVVGVGALDADGHRAACFSNRGWWVDAAAPGVGVHSTFVEWSGKVAAHPGEAPDACKGELPPQPSGKETYEGWAYWDGTSFAAPRVAAAIAARIGEGHRGPDAVFDVLHAPDVHRVAGVGAVVNPLRYP